MIVRDAEKEDLAKIAALEKIIFDDNNFPMSLRNLRYHFKKGNKIYVAKIDNHLAGYAVIFLRKDYARIYSIAINPDYNGKGIGNLLMKHIIAKHSDKKYISLEVRSDNTRAIKLYEKFGFKVVKILPEYYDDGCSGYKMKKIFT